MQKTKLSSKGQIVLPKSIRDLPCWEPGMEFAVEPTDNGVLLRPAPAFPHAEMEEVAGCLASNRKPVKSLSVRQGIEKKVRRRHDSGQY